MTTSPRPQCERMDSVPIRFEIAVAFDDGVVGRTERRRCLRAADGRVFVGKNDHCTKTPGHSNAAWLGNELIFAEYARQAGLRVPELRLLLCEGREYLGSELLPGR